MRERPEIKDWQMVAFVALLMVASVVIIAAVGLKFLVRWLMFRWSER